MPPNDPHGLKRRITAARTRLKALLAEVEGIEQDIHAMGPQSLQRPPEAKGDAGRFFAWWCGIYPTYRGGAAYLGNPERDRHDIETVLRVYPLARAQQLAEVFLQIQPGADKFLDSGSGRTIGKFRSYASRIDELLRSKESKS